MDLMTHVWTTIKFDGLFTPRTGHCLFPYKDSLMIFSGIDSNRNILCDF